MPILHGTGTRRRFRFGEKGWRFGIQEANFKIVAPERKEERFRRRRWS
jgi:hypothetical protein